MEENNNKEGEYFLAKWLEGSISDQDLKNLVSEGEYKSYIKLKGGIKGFELLEQPLKPSFDLIQKRIDIKKNQKLKNINIRWGISIAASILVVFGLFFIFNSQKLTYKTSYAEQKSFELPDGSEVILNAMSELIFDEKDWELNRSLELKGEAYFKVKKGSDFTVNTNNGQVTVLGTQFNVNSSLNYFEVKCYEGKVKVTNSMKDYILKPSNSLRKINGHTLEENRIDNPYPSWTKGESDFKSVPLKYVILSLEKQYNVKINANKIDDTRIFTGSFNHKNLEIALASVFKTMDIKYLKKKNGIISLE